MFPILLAASQNRPVVVNNLEDMAGKMFCSASATVRFDLSFRERFCAQAPRVQNGNCVPGGAGHHYSSRECRARSCGDCEGFGHEFAIPDADREL